MKKNMSLVKILAVDDERTILNSLCRFFVEAGCIFVAADSGTEGLSVLQHASTFDVIISDYRMPGMNGIEFLAAARELQPESFRILLTGMAPGKDIVAAIKSGTISAYVPKPWDNNQLLDLIENLISEKQ